MTPEQIKKWAIAAGEHALRYHNPTGPLAYAYRNLRDTEFARLVAQDTYEDAAKMCDLGFRRSMDARVATGCARCAKAIRIRAAAAKEAKP